MQRKLLLCGLLIIVSAGWCQAVNAPAAFAAAAYPAQITLGDITADWVKVTIPGAAKVDIFLRYAMAGHGMPRVGQELTLTRGQIVSLAGLSYLVIYRQESAIPHNEEEWKARTILTPQTVLLPSLVSLGDVTTITYAGPFDLKREIRASALQRLAISAARGEGNNGAVVRSALQLMRAAISQFKEDTGAWPAALADLVRSANDSPPAGIDANGKSITIAAGAYAGPYLPAQDGIPEAPGVPLNPYIDVTREAPDPTLVATHWLYRNGAVSVPQFLFGILTDDGRMLGEL